MGCAHQATARPGTSTGRDQPDVDGRRLIAAQQGFGQLWQRTYRVRLADPALTPVEVVSAWKERFSEFWPAGNHLYGAFAQRAPGELARINLSPMPGPIKLTTGVMVIYADDVSFTFMSPEGHMHAGWNTFSAYVEDGATYAQVQIQWRRVLNTWRNAAMWSGLSTLTAPLRWAAHRVRLL